MSKIDTLIQIATNEVGYLEKATNSNLDNKTANAGSANYTKYARDLIKWIGSPYTNGVAWCDMFVDWCFITAFGKDEAKRLLGGWSAYTPSSANFFKSMGGWYSAPQVGDQIFFKNNTRICHTGIVYKVDSTKVYTIEGNTSAGNNTVVANGGAVAKKSYALNNSRIAGYGRPNYGNTTSSKAVSNELSMTNNAKKNFIKQVQEAVGGLVVDGIAGTKTMNAVNNLEVSMKVNSKHKVVRPIQSYMNYIGHSVGKVDGEFGSKTREGVANWQRDNNLMPDGEIGPKSWKKLLQ